MKSLLKYSLAKLGYEITRKRKTEPIGETKTVVTPFNVDEFQYDTIRPTIKYAPWLQDDEFMNTYSQITGHTLVDIYRCYELWEMVEIINNLDDSASFIEIGVWRGGTAAIIGKKLSLLNSNVPFYIADTFSGVVKVSTKDATYKGGEHADTSPEIVKMLLKNKYSNYKILAGIFPDETSKLIDTNKSFGFCHIDVDVYDSAKDIVEWIWNKLIVGGIIVFDDYGYPTCTGITRYVNQQKHRKDRVIFYNTNGHAIMVKLY
ncbi:MAG TPA: TylF/MycF/NovP-related O-methyltransferase [Hanamia sp.]|nr:TylF/MycF/NovP-related O-methyltransferase [Hanamia sp.]